MKSCFKGVLISLGMFTTIPVPFFAWDEESLRWVTPAMPLAGGVVGLVWWGGAVGLQLWQPPALLHAFFLMALPFLVTGLLHLDGFMDTMDALLSNRDREERLRILKDPHMGAFGVAAFMLALLLWFCSASAVTEGHELRPLLLLPIVTRALVGLLLVAATPISPTGYAATFSARPLGFARLWLGGVAVAVLAVALLWGGWALLLPVAVAAAVIGLAAWLLLRTFGGISGDLCGCLLVVGELAGVLIAGLL